MSRDDELEQLPTRILLVDDRHENLVALRAILEPLGQELVFAASGKEALKHVLKSDFAVILLDVLMPELDGFETATLIKQREQSRAVPIIFLTAVNTHEQFVFQGYSVGAVDYISKPINPEILRSKVAVFVELFRKNEKIKRQAALLRQAQELEQARAIAELKLESDRRYAGLAESLPEIVCSTAPDGAIKYCNREWIDLAARGAPWKQLFHPEHLPTFEQRWGKALSTGEEFELELRVQRAPGAPHRWHLVRALPVRDAREASPPVVGSWVVTCTDIDDRRRAEDALRFLAEASTLLSGSLEQQATIPRVAELAVASVADWCVIDLRGPGGAMRRVAVAHSDPDDAEIARAIAALPVNETQEPSWHAEHGLEGVLLGAQAKPRELEAWHERLGPNDCIVAPLVARGASIGRVALARTGFGRAFGPAKRNLVEDLARKIVAAIDNAQLYEIAQEERARLERANRAKDEFLAIVSHELRTPLNAVLVWAQILKAGGIDGDTVARGIETIERNARAQARLIGDMLDVARIISGKLQLRIRPLDLAEVVRAVVESLQPEAQTKGVAIECASASVGTISGDAERLQQVIWNLLSNAVKFTPAGGRVTIALADADSTVSLEVKDTGVGISPDFLPHIFDRFVQGEAGLSRGRGGLGLGLSIVHHIVALHSGKVFASSEGLGRGATFTVKLPRADVTLPAIDGRASPSADLSLERELAGLRLLVVEDVADGREVLERVLTQSGAQVTSVGSSGDALRELATREFDLLLSDIGLPDESGYELMRKARSRGVQAPAVALTAYAADADRDQALAAGFQAHCAKPIDVKSLVKLLRSLMPRV